MVEFKYLLSLFIIAILIAILIYMIYFIRAHIPKGPYTWISNLYSFILFFIATVCIYLSCAFPYLPCREGGWGNPSDEQIDQAGTQPCVLRYNQQACKVSPSCGGGDGRGLYECLSSLGLVSNCPPLRSGFFVSNLRWSTTIGEALWLFVWQTRATLSDFEFAT